MFWGLSNADRCKAIGIERSEQIKDAEIVKVFGRKSDSLTAQQLQRSDPARYSLMRAIFKARNLQ